MKLTILALSLAIPFVARAEEDVKTPVDATTSVSLLTDRKTVACMRPLLKLQKSNKVKANAPFTRDPLVALFPFVILGDAGEEIGEAWLTVERNAQGKVENCSFQQAEPDSPYQP